MTDTKELIEGMRALSRALIAGDVDIRLPEVSIDPDDAADALERLSAERDDSFVPLSLYESAVRGRSDFRQALTAERERRENAERERDAWFKTHDAHRKANEAMGAANAELLRRVHEAETARDHLASPDSGGEAEAELRYATRLLISLMEKHYPDRSPEWAPLPDLMGVLTQIDNITTGMSRGDPPASAPVTGEINEQAVKVCPRCDGEGGYPDGLDEASCHTECTRCGSNGWIVDVASLARKEAGK